MIVTIAEIIIRPGDENAFIAAYREARRHIADSPGCRMLRLVRGIEQPNRFLLFSEWVSLESHIEGFYGSDGFLSWRAGVCEYFAEPPCVEHVVDLRDRSDE
ncbi:hypothetical protein GCM10022247_41150 [Allokutzneria multivorans]|uniref:ABM domain-containing protein n=2 Tax=Allokutzneria TaxID=1137960 RepID=A0ABP7SPD5_9PSEU